MSAFAVGASSTKESMYPLNTPDGPLYVMNLAEFKSLNERFKDGAAYFFWFLVMNWVVNWLTQLFFSFKKMGLVGELVNAMKDIAQSLRTAASQLGNVSTSIEKSTMSDSEESNMASFFENIKGRVDASESTHWRILYDTPQIDCLINFGYHLHASIKTEQAEYSVTRVSNSVHVIKNGVVEVNKIGFFPQLGLIFKEILE
ncbi:hypothetical protein DICA0_E07602 [Diutina catenulata]